MDKRIELVFQDSEGMNTTITLDSPRLDITALEVKTAMEGIIAQNVLVSNRDIGITTAYKSRIVSISTEELQI